MLNYDRQLLPPHLSSMEESLEEIGNGGIVTSLLNVGGQGPGCLLHVLHALAHVLHESKLWD